MTTTDPIYLNFMPATMLPGTIPGLLRRDSPVLMHLPTSDLALAGTFYDVVVTRKGRKGQRNRTIAEEAPSASVARSVGESRVLRMGGRAVAEVFENGVLVGTYTARKGWL